MQDGENALHLAARRGHVSTIRYLVPRIESLLHSTDAKGYTVLHVAAEEGRTEVVRVVVDDYKLYPTARDKVCFMSAPNPWVGVSVSECMSLGVYYVVIAV